MGKPKFTGELSSLGELQTLAPIHHLTWDWWWWLVMLDGDEKNPAGRQLMVLWSTKDNSFALILLLSVFFNSAIKYFPRLFHLYTSEF